MSRCAYCGKVMSDKSLVELVEAVEDYRQNFGTEDDKPDLICNDCYDKREDDDSEEAS